MFDTTVIKHGDNHHTHTITEKRAPTDESVRLLREMESSARKEVLKAIQLPSNEFSGVVHLMHDALSCNTNFAVLFKLNNKDHRVLVTINDFTDDSRDKQIEKIVSEVSNYLAGNILQGIFKADQLRELIKE